MVLDVGSAHQHNINSRRKVRVEKLLGNVENRACTRHGRTWRREERDHEKEIRNLLNSHEGGIENRAK